MGAAVVNLLKQHARVSKELRGLKIRFAKELGSDKEFNLKLKEVLQLPLGRQVEAMQQHFDHLRSRQGSEVRGAPAPGGPPARGVD